MKISGEQKQLNRIRLLRAAIEMIGEDEKGAVITFDDITELQSAQRKAAWADVARRIADLYLDRAESFLPVVWVEPNQDVYVYLLNGITIEGLPQTAEASSVRQSVFD